MKSFVLLGLVILLMAGCGGAPLPAMPTTAMQTAPPTLTLPPPDSAPASSATPAPTDAITPTAEPTAVPRPTTAPSATADVSKEDLRQTYALLAMIQAETSLLDETAQRIAAGEIEGMDSLAAVLVVGAVTTAVDEAINEHVPPATLEPFWEDAASIHAETRTLFTRWFDKEIASDTVLAEIASPLADIEALLSEVDALLQTHYALDPAELGKWRTEFVEGIRDVLNTPTPSPETATTATEVASDASYTEGDYLYIIGEVRNTGSVPLEYVKVVATLYDGTDEVIGTESTYTILDVISPGGKAPFEMMTSDWEGMTRYKLQLQSSEGDLPEALVSVASHRDRIDGDYYHIVGEVKNESTAPAEYVKVIATLYDEADKVVGVTASYTVLDVIPPGGRSPFELTTDHWNKADHYELQVQASPGDLGRQDIAVKSHKSSLDGNYMSILGEVQNTGLTEAEYVKVIVTFYASDGTVAGVAYTYTELDTIPAGGTSPFEIFTPHDPSFDHYEIQVQAQ